MYKWPFYWEKEFAILFRRSVRIENNVSNVDRSNLCGSFLKKCSGRVGVSKWNRFFEDTLTSIELFMNIEMNYYYYELNVDKLRKYETRR